MRILVAPDSFKGSLGAAEAAGAIARGLARVWPDAVIDRCPLTDGGEGFLAAMLVPRLPAGAGGRQGEDAAAGGRQGEGAAAGGRQAEGAAAGGRLVEAETTNAVGERVTARYAELDGGDTVAIELSSAAGLVQVPADRRDPLHTTTYGVGRLIARAWERRPFKRLLLALGGSATVDGGAGLLEALGVRFLDDEGLPVPRGGGGLARLARIDTTALAPALREAEVMLAVDVTNPLLGPRGAAPVYGPQKGADPPRVAALEAALARYADALQAATGVRVHDLPGSGSAGGVPAGLVAIAGARCVPGFELAAEAVGLDARLAGCDLVATGEGMLDRASFEGKVVGRLAARCRPRGIPLVALVGMVTPEGEARLAELGGAAMTLVPGPIGLEEACARAEELLEAAACRFARVVSQGRGAPGGRSAP